MPCHSSHYSPGLGLLARAWLALAVAVALTSATTVLAQTPIALPGGGDFPESIAATPDGAIYVGSLGTGGVYRIAPGAKIVTPWIKPGAFGTHSTFGVSADPKSNTLWVCSNDLSALGVTISGSDGVSALKGFDLKTGQGTVSALLPGTPALCNDITIGPDGAAYVTNTLAPQILRLAPGATTLEVWFTDPALQPANGSGLDGLSFGPDGNLYVDRYTPGDLYRINVKSGKATGATRLSPSRPLVLTDAIRPYGKDRFLLIEGGGRLDSLTTLRRDSCSPRDFIGTESLGAPNPRPRLPARKADAGTSEDQRTRTSASRITGFPTFRSRSRVFGFGGTLENH